LSSPHSVILNLQFASQVFAESAHVSHSILADATLLAVKSTHAQSAVVVSLTLTYQDVQRSIHAGIFKTKVLRSFHVFVIVKFTFHAALTPETNILEAKAIALNHAIIFFIFIIFKLFFINHYFRSFF